MFAPSRQSSEPADGDHVRVLKSSAAQETAIPNVSKTAKARIEDDWQSLSKQARLVLTSA